MFDYHSDLGFHRSFGAKDRLCTCIFTLCRRNGHDSLDPTDLRMILIQNLGCLVGPWLQVLVQVCLHDSPMRRASPCEMSHSELEGSLRSAGRGLEAVESGEKCASTRSQAPWSQTDLDFDSNSADLTCLILTAGCTSS